MSELDEKSPSEILVAFDNFFTSPKVMETCMIDRFKLFGTARKNKKVYHLWKVIARDESWGSEWQRWDIGENNLHVILLPVETQESSDNSFKFPQFFRINNKKAETKGAQDREKINVPIMVKIDNFSKEASISQTSSKNATRSTTWPSTIYTCICNMIDTSIYSSYIIFKKL